MSRRTGRLRRSWVVVAAAAVVLVSCNPLLGDPESVGGALERQAATYTGPTSAWIELAVTGAPAQQVFVLALVQTDALRGPTERSCAGPGGTLVPCAVLLQGVQTPSQRVVAGNGSEYVRLMTVFPDEVVDIVIVCVDDDTQELGCPPALRTALRTVDGTGARVGDLLPAQAV